jgi:hypothetical protein
MSIIADWSCHSQQRLWHSDEACPFSVVLWKQTSSTDLGPAALPRGCLLRFLTFLTGGSFVFNNLTVLLGNFGSKVC